MRAPRRSAAVLALALALSACIGQPAAEAPPEDIATVAEAEGLTADPAPAAPRRGLLALLRGGPADPAAPVADAPEEVGVPAEAQTEGEAEAGAPPARSGGGLLALFGGGRGGASGAATVTPGAPLPFGEVGIACGLSARQMGREVDRFPREGRAVWRLYDSDPASTGPRPQYITGFADNCARQVSAALVTFGAPGVHEAHRYSAAMKGEPWSQADTRYEAIKGRICGVGRGVPCPAGRADRLERSVAFVSVYHRFGDSGRWLELLLHDGRLEAQELR